MKSSRGLTFFALFFSGFPFLATPTYATDASRSPDAKRMVQDIHTLSHPDFSGRQTGTEGGHRSATYVANGSDNWGSPLLAICPSELNRFCGDKPDQLR